MKIIALDEIKEILPSLDLFSAIEAGFASYSAGHAVVPPVGELVLDKGEVHIKYGFLENSDYYVIKIASGFYENPKINLPSSNGLMLLFSQGTGELVSILLDEGHLTDVRTAVAGAVAAKYLAPENVERIGVVGAGVQARLQVLHLEQVTRCRDVLVWGRDKRRVSDYMAEMEGEGWSVEAARDTDILLDRCNLIVTTTPSVTPLLNAASLRPGTHITAVGSDTPDKRELDSAILQKADVVVADSISQCLLRGEIFQAIRAGRITRDAPVELGLIISGRAAGRMSEEQITVADLTGVAVQDIMIATAVYEALCKN